MLLLSLRNTITSMKNYFEDVSNDVSLFGFFRVRSISKTLRWTSEETLPSMIQSSNLAKNLVDSLDSPPIFLHVRRGDPNLVDLEDLSGRTRNACRNIHHNRWLLRRALKEFLRINQLLLFVRTLLSGGSGTVSL